MAMARRWMRSRKPQSPATKEFSTLADFTNSPGFGRGFLFCGPMQRGSSDPRPSGPDPLEQTDFPRCPRRKGDTLVNSLDAFVGLVFAAVFVTLASAPALVALARGSRPSRHGLSRSLRQRLLAVALSIALVILLLWLFGYLDNYASPSWIGWWD